VKRKFKFSSWLCSTPAVRPYIVPAGGTTKVNERRTVVGGWLATRLAVDLSTVGGGHTCVPPNRGERSTRMVQCPAHDQARRETWPKHSVKGSTTSVEFPGEDWAGDHSLTGNERERWRPPSNIVLDSVLFSRSVYRKWRFEVGTAIQSLRSRLWPSRYRHRNGYYRQPIWTQQPPTHLYDRRSHMASPPLEFHGCSDTAPSAFGLCYYSWCVCRLLESYGQQWAPGLYSVDRSFSANVHSSSIHCCCSTSIFSHSTLAPDLASLNRFFSSVIQLWHEYCCIVLWH